jgi:hypothetical protein
MNELGHTLELRRFSISTFIEETRSRLQACANNGFKLQSVLEFRVIKRGPSTFCSLRILFFLT